MHLGRSPEHLVLRCLEKKIHTQKSASEVFPSCSSETISKAQRDWTGDVLAGGCAHRQFVQAWRMRRMVLTVGGGRDRPSDRSHEASAAVPSDEDMVSPHASDYGGEKKPWTAKSR